MTEFGARHELVRDPAVRRFLLLPSRYERRHATGYISIAPKESRHVRAFHAVVQRRSDGTILGVAGFRKIHSMHRRAEIGYWLGKAHLGDGFGREVAGALTRFAFRDLGLRKAYAHTFVDNLRSERLLAACGFEEGGLHRSEVKTRGRWRDLRRWGLVRGG